MTDKIKIGVVFGGTSNEREVSLFSGSQIINNLNKEKYDIRTYDSKINLKELISDCLDKKIDFCLIALHGRGGEDGSIQGMLDLLKMPYSGSGTISSALCLDKSLAKKIVKLSGLLVPNDLIIKKNDWQNNKNGLSETILNSFKLPLVVKPNSAGSSVGVNIVKNENQLIEAIEESFWHDQVIILEEYLKGLEVTAPILGDRALPLIEIIPTNEFFDYEAKYTVGQCQEIIPARLSNELTKEVQQQALKIAEILKCQGLSRIDFIIRDKEIFFLETNTIPGMTANSLCPKSAQADGLNFSDLLDKIIELALKK
ncbi:MAG: hypothetical protein A3B89_03320 [Candidatus Buchananbacteria bacterium RIFCSPHIGHO2_02_FULL_40_13]|uniref:D-alanine--D-alanine ligase n=1 Tax=Candidatus Buchananbacteria bacterium RIFCSPLOWO2_01_FULL_39_33 TaxID=1797543 RepID=A0A1G1YK04_9BACT|nr:MAG: hypothetical protein A3B89_03320 [Candidatus Buchananbacteria bacterium RIFCSPHIGHO2_02_FULL_40_13]OGY51797.1 MAG: hypothetical protein A3A02_04175 [Candidatus Buchananbacteria bacterium RIFCSPLOWO2_01_FULL_39_33]